MTRTVLVSGASSGIGYELARVFAKEGNNVILVARNEAKLNEIAQEIRQQYHVRATVVAADLSDPASPPRIYKDLLERNIHVDILVNNAGFGNFGLFAETDTTRELELIQVNVVALTHLTKLFLPAMVEQRYGRILNVASTAAFQPGPLMANYFASKAFVLSLSEALAYELVGSGVTVTALCPGPTRTQFQDTASMQKSKLFAGKIMDAESVAKVGYKATMQGKTLVVPGWKNHLLASFARLVPRKWILPVAKKMVEVSER